ncbi:unnamed protein product [Lupinus luteus]|uniref:Uncharacterized protein n=1 Tax=Lupinus luteus TaxID=3873 RepID=A0AAV1XFX0_LUPLU
MGLEKPEMVAVDGACGHAPPCGGWWFSAPLKGYVKKVIFTNGQTNFETQLIPTHMDSYDYYAHHIALSRLKLDIDSETQMLYYSNPNIVQLMANNTYMMNSANQFGSPLDSATQVGSANHVGVPLDLTIQSDPAIVSRSALPVKSVASQVGPIDLAMKKIENKVHPSTDIVDHVNDYGLQNALKNSL